jgi:hypothetical protein
MDIQAGRERYPSAATKPVKIFPGACRSQQKMRQYEKQNEVDEKPLKLNRIITSPGKKAAVQICGTASFLTFIKAVQLTIFSCNNMPPAFTCKTYKPSGNYLLNKKL